jgi:DNA-binding response OmpR family regulator
MRKLIVCEDDEMIRKIFVKSFQMTGNYEVTEAKTGKELEDLLKIQKFDVILLDILLPDAHGVLLLKKLRDGGDRTPVFLLTNVDEQEIVIHAFQYGAAGYFIKAKYEPQRIVDEVDEYFVKKDGEKTAGSTDTTPTTS